MPSSKPNIKMFSIRPPLEWFLERNIRLFRGGQKIQTCGEHLGDLPGAHKEIMIFHQKKGKKWCMLNEGFKALSVKTTSKSHKKSSYEWNKKKGVQALAIWTLTVCLIDESCGKWRLNHPKAIMQVLALRMEIFM